MSKKSSLLSKSNAAVRLGALLSLITATVFAAWVLSGNLGMNEAYEAVVYVLTAVSYLLIVPSTLLAIAGRATSLALRYGVVALTIIVLVVLMLLAIGLLQDSAGVHCTDLWGWSTQQCAHVMQSWVFYYLFLPPIFVPTTVVISALLGFGLIAEYRQSQSRRKLSRRK